MIYGSVSWVVVGSGPTVTQGQREALHGPIRAAQNSKDITMPVIKWLGVKGSGYKTAQRKRTIGEKRILKTHTLV